MWLSVLTQPLHTVCRLTPGRLPSNATRQRSSKSCRRPARRKRMIQAGYARSQRRTGFAAPLLSLAMPYVVAPVLAISPIARLHLTHACESLPLPAPCVFGFVHSQVLRQAVTSGVGVVAPMRAHRRRSAAAARCGGGEATRGAATLLCSSRATPLDGVRVLELASDLVDSSTKHGQDGNALRRLCVLQRMHCNSPRMVATGAFCPELSRVPLNSKQHAVQIPRSATGVWSVLQRPHRARCSNAVTVLAGTQHREHQWLASEQQATVTIVPRIALACLGCGGMVMGAAGPLGCGAMGVFLPVGALAAP